MKKIILVVTICIALCACESSRHRNQLYQAWCKLNKRQDITLQEWQLLRDNYMLPGGDSQRAVDAANTAAAMSAAAMGMSTGSRK